MHGKGVFIYPNGNRCDRFVNDNQSLCEEVVVSYTHPLEYAIPYPFQIRGGVQWGYEGGAGRVVVR